MSTVSAELQPRSFSAEGDRGVLRQTFQDFELILLDDGSTDDSRSILSRYRGDPRMRIEFNEVNSGSGFKQWNKVMRLARGGYVWIEKSDDNADEGRFATSS